MQDRRKFLTTALLSAAGLGAIGLPGIASGIGPGSAAGAVSGANLGASLGGVAASPMARYGAFYLVDGWVLTAQDVQALDRSPA